METTSNQYKSSLRSLASSVSIVTMLEGQRKHGLTISAFISLSLDPPLIGVAIDQNHSAHDIIASSGKFALNVLNHNQDQLSNRFAFVKDEDRFAEGNWVEAPSGLPVLEDATFWLDCTVVDRSPAGSHTLFIGEVTSQDQNQTPPLVYWQGDYRSIK